MTLDLTLSLLVVPPLYDSAENHEDHERIARASSRTHGGYPTGNKRSPWSLTFRMFHHHLLFIRC